MFVKIITILAPLFIVVALGYVYGLKLKPNMDVINQLIMSVFMPALILTVMLSDGFNLNQYSGLAIGGSLVMLGSGLLAYPVAKLCGFSWRVFVPPAMFSNWANLGLPLYVYVLGEQALGAGIILVVIGNLLFFTIGTYIYAGRLSIIEFVKTPIILAVAAGLLMNLSSINLYQPVTTAIQSLGDVAIPLMLFSLGVRLNQVSLNDSKIGLVVALFCPIIGIALALLVLQFIEMNTLHKQVLILFSALPPAVANYILAEQYHDHPAQVASIVLVGNLIALFTLPIVLYIVL